MENINQPISTIYACLQRLIGLHRQLWETVKMEHESLVQAELKGIQEATSAKQACLEMIRQTESDRLKALGELALLWKKPVKELTLNQIILLVQDQDMKSSEQLRSTLNALTILIKRVSEQNQANQVLVEKSLEHVHEMKKNVLGESVPKSNTYTAQGQRVNGSTGARLISKEA